MKAFMQIYNTAIVEACCKDRQERARGVGLTSRTVSLSLDGRQLSSTPSGLTTMTQPRLKNPNIVTATTLVQNDGQLHSNHSWELPKSSDNNSYVSV